MLPKPKLYKPKKITLIKAKRPSGMSSMGMTISRNKMPNIFKDKDGDLTPDLIDCKPNNPRKPNPESVFLFASVDAT